MTKTQKLTFTALAAALAATLTLTAYFPYITYAAPAVAGLVMLVVVIEINCKWALGTFLASLVPVLLLTEPEAKLLYLFLFGWYPIAKARIESIHKNAIEWLLKILLFNLSVVAAYTFSSVLTDMNLQNLGVFGKYSVLVLWAFGNAIFVFYDIAVSQVALFYTLRIHPKIKKLFHNKK